MSKTFTGFMMGMVLLFAAIKGAYAADLKPASGILVAQCNNTIAVILVDKHGVLHPVPPAQIEAQGLDAVLATIPLGKGVTVTVPCIQQLDEV